MKKSNIIWIIIGVIIIFCGAKVDNNVKIEYPNFENTTFQKPYIEQIEEDQIFEEIYEEEWNIIKNCKITYYDICLKCCGKTDGITSTGEKAQAYVTAAVDPKVIPLGSELKVVYDDGCTLYLIAQDTGSSVKYNKIDICVSTHQEALNLGVSMATVYWR